MPYLIITFLIFLFSQFAVASQNDDKAQEVEKLKSIYGGEALQYYKYQPERKFPAEMEDKDNIDPLEDCGCSKTVKTKVVGPIISKQSSVDIRREEFYTKKWQTKQDCPKCKCNCKPKKSKKKTIQKKPKSLPAKVPTKPKNKISNDVSTKQKSISKITKTKKDVIVKKYYIYRDNYITCCGNGQDCDGKNDKESKEKNIILRCE